MNVEIVREQSPGPDNQRNENPKALAVITPQDNQASYKNGTNLEGFTISKEIVLTLRKNNLCIRPIANSNVKKGNTTQRRRNREMTILLRTWEKEAEDNLEIEVNQGLENSLECVDGDEIVSL